MSESSFLQTVNYEFVWADKQFLRKICEQSKTKQNVMFINSTNYCLVCKSKVEVNVVLCAYNCYIFEWKCIKNETDSLFLKIRRYYIGYNKPVFLP